MLQVFLGLVAPKLSILAKVLGILFGCAVASIMMQCTSLQICALLNACTAHSVGLVCWSFNSPEKFSSVIETMLLLSTQFLLHIKEDNGLVICCGAVDSCALLAWTAVPSRDAANFDVALTVLSRACSMSADCSLQ